MGVPVLLQRYSAGRLQHRLPGPLRLVLVLVVLLLVLLLRLLLLTLSPPQCPPVDWRISGGGNCLSGPQGKPMTNGSKADWGEALRRISAPLEIDDEASASASASAAPAQCGKTTSYCPTTFPCCQGGGAKYSPSGWGCAVPVSAAARASANCGFLGGDLLPTDQTRCCKMGPANPPSTTLKNVLVIGDSVSIGYVPGVTAQLAASKTAAVRT